MTPRLSHFVKRTERHPFAESDSPSPKMHTPSRLSCHGVRLKAVRRGGFHSATQHSNSAVVPDTVKIVLKKRKNP